MERSGALKTNQFAYQKKCLGTQSLISRSQQVMVDGSRSKLVNIVSGNVFSGRKHVGQCFWPVIVTPIHYEAFSHSRK